ncbi:MAG: FAD-dependent monooxygenase [Trueperaceae bacterium]|nr:MAG: FAD-dependent monooxygenase [Trueperaceae bacterium]
MSPARVAADAAAATVLVVGAGPVGLLVAARLLLLGVPTRIVERREAPGCGSRAIGVHPPGLAALASVGADADVLAAGVRIAEGRAFGAHGQLGSLRFDGDTPVLAVPQAVSEAALRSALERAGGRVERGVTLTGLRRGSAGYLEATVLGADEAVVDAAVVLGCDGPGSSVRTLAGIGWRGGAYRDRYLMADLPDVSSLGARAEIRLHRAGLLESFPLPGGWRRVVVRVPDEAATVAAERRGAVDGGPARPGRVDPNVAARVCALAVERGGEHYDAEAARMTSAFGIERRLATRFALGHVALAGDAAHVLSPIGGQGMNLGWIDAVALADGVARGLERGPGALRSELEAYGQRRRRAAQAAAWRADLNTRLGRPVGPLGARLRDAVLARALRAPFDRALTGAFTMRGLA